MAVKSNKEIMQRVQKADLSLGHITAGGGVLETGFFPKFLRLVTKKAVLMQGMTVFGMQEFKRKINTVRFGSRVLKPGTPGQALSQAQRSRPDFLFPTLDTQLFKAEVLVEDEVFEDNIEMDALRNTLMQLVGDAISRDTEFVLINGDTTSTDPLLAKLDGIIKQVTSHTKDAAGARLTRDLLRDGRKTLPSEYRMDPRIMRWWVSPNVQDDFAEAIGDRATKLGDDNVEETIMPKHRSVPVMAAPEWPENLGAGDRSVAILTNPLNFNVGFHKRVEIRATEDIQAGTVILVARLRFDGRFADEDGTAKVFDVLAS